MDGIAASTAGILNAARRQNVIAHNIANLATPGFRALRVDSVELTGTAQTTPAAAETADAAQGASNVNLASEMTALVANTNAYRANLKAFAVQADLVGELLDISR